MVLKKGQVRARIQDSDESDEETVQEPVERAAEDSDTEAEQDTASPK